MNTEKYTINGCSLASRSAAVSEREKLASAISRGSVVVYDLSSVVSISSSYADELFGVLVMQFGLDKVLGSLKVVGANRGVLRVIAEAMKERTTASAA
ncbi:MULTISPECIES: STAS-like domain-containing protein [Marinobacter]|jgi:hypothetical protein|uniref:STAS-like domain-containing protein n=1 Tax=Marinobacter TaxID=2742 RepID=UPI0009ECDA87|nr:MULTISPECIES: DUF4325 domain-containing protein [Marinobacter]QTN43079.1 DUF4325 domain-containing protein [Marinobacter salsuginis]